MFIKVTETRWGINEMKIKGRSEEAWKPERRLRIKSGARFMIIPYSNARTGKVRLELEAG